MGALSLVENIYIIVARDWTTDFIAERGLEYFGFCVCARLVHLFLSCAGCVKQHPQRNVLLRLFVSF